MNKINYRLAACALAAMALIPAVVWSRNPDPYASGLRSMSQGLDPTTAKDLGMTPDEQRKLVEARSDMRQVFDQKMQELSNKLSPPGRLTGTAKAWYPGMRHGFITPENGAKDIFVSVRALEASGLTELVVGKVYEFKAVKPPKSNVLDAHELKLL